ncbi:MAG TPA: methylmalonyl-CoA mutase family protein, partial [Deltaproteobacteria bacterium]|nr:methylmalonyl-CoA mutase family protein [Deltaproteobacteria bacterium]
AEERQKAKLESFRRERDSKTSASALRTLREKARDESINLMPYICECVENDCTLGEICDVFREVFGEAQPVRL